MADDRTARLTAALDRLRNRGALRQPVPTPDDIADAEADAGGPMPAALRQVFGRADGIDFGDVDIVDLDTYVSFNELPDRFTELPEAVIFGSDGGDGVYFLDPGNALGEGPETVYFGLLGALAADLSRPVAPDLAEFVDRAASRTLPKDAANLEQIAMERLFSTVGKRPERINLRAPLDYLSRIDPALDVVSYGPGLSAFYEHCDGLAIPAEDVDVVGMEGVTAVASTLNAQGRPGALDIGRIGNRRLIVTTGTWRNLPGGRLMVVGAGENPAQAAPLGRFTDVLRAWIEGGGTS